MTCIFSNLFLASRMICDRSSHNNLGAKPKWQKGVTQGVPGSILSVGTLLYLYLNTHKIPIYSQ